MRSSKTVWRFIALVFLLPVMAYALVTWYQNKYEKVPVYNLPGKNLLAQLSSYNLINQDGRRLDSNDWNKKILVVDFFFTHCPTICPKMTSSLKDVATYFNKEKFLQIASFSVDPERDSAAQLKKHALRFNINTHNWNLITGAKTDIYKLARNGFGIVATDGDGGPDDFIHSDKIVLVDKQKNIRGYYDGTNKDEIGKLITDIKKLKNEN